ncbi:unnamed protein product [Paramecium primaurelia]|uniref:Uncharacterized protein n=1 Tax=Paramecium primaurelia TaxID=5886 RepID=A0A8S1QVU7_PARPR|nr:unnamed protein product [Paramecium primaurelia]
MNREFNEKTVYKVFIYQKMNNQFPINKIFQRFNYLKQEISKLSQSSFKEQI